MPSVSLVSIDSRVGPRLRARQGLRQCVVAIVLLFLGTVVEAQSGDNSPSLESYSARGADTCLLCHRDPTTLAIFQTTHGNPGLPGGPFDHGELQCEACHGPGGAHTEPVGRGQTRAPVVEFGRDSTAAPTTIQDGMCLACHSELTTAWQINAHEYEQVGCADCHTSHAARDPVAVTATQQDVCYQCHAKQRSARLKPFAHPLDDAKMDCGACHSMHKTAGEALLVRPTLNQTCFQCHAEKRGPFLWEHAPAAEDCGLCHDAHGTVHPGMLVQRGPFLCQGCHTEAGHPSFLNDPGGLAAGSPSQFLLGQNCMNCHSQVHGSNHPSGSRLMR